MITADIARLNVALYEDQLRKSIEYNYQELEKAFNEEIQAVSLLGLYSTSSRSISYILHRNCPESRNWPWNAYKTEYQKIAEKYGFKYIQMYPDSFSGNDMISWQQSK